MNPTSSLRVRRVLLRRWYFVLIGLVLTAGLALAASFAEPVEHEARASVVLLPPADPSSNPYLGLAGYQGFADVFARSMMDTTSVLALRSAGVSDDFTVERDLTTNAPIVRVTVTGVDADEAIRQMKVIVGAMPGNLVSIQQAANVPVASMFQSKVITQDVEATSIRKAQLRAMIAAAGLGVLLTIWGTVWIDSMLSRRSVRVRSRHAAQRAGAASDAPSAESSSESESAVAPSAEPSSESDSPVTPESALESGEHGASSGDSDSAASDDPRAEASAADSPTEPQPPTADADGIVPPTADADGIVPPTAATDGIVPPTADGAGIVPPTADGAGIVPPTAAADGIVPPRETRRPNGGPAAARASEIAHGRRETRVSRRRSSQGGRA